MTKRIARTFALGIVIIIGAVGCGSPAKPPATTATDVVSQKITPQGKIPVTVLVKNAFSINTFEKAVEEKFPQLDIIQVGNFTSDMGIAEYEARMEHNDMTDMVMTWPVSAGEEYFSQRLIEMSAMPFSDKYVKSMLNNIARDGKLYYLPGPSQVRGIVYNKTLFRENNWEVPTDFDGFIALCKKIEQSGIRSLQLGLKNSEVLDTAFFGYGYENSLRKPENAQWLANYNTGVGNFADNFKPALDTFQKLIDEGVLKSKDLDVDYSVRENMIFNRKCAMVEDSVLLARMGTEYNGCTDEFGIMPFFNSGKDSDWARLYPVCYVGASKNLEQPENKEKLSLVTQVLEYISTPEGQAALAGDTGGMFSSLKGVAPSDISEFKDLMTALNNGRYAVFPTLKNSQNALREGLAKMLKGELDATGVSDMVNKENLSPPVITPSPVVGSATENFTLMETGNYITDTMREQSGSDIALFLDNGKDGKQNGRGVAAKIYSGEITKADIKRILPDFKQGEKGDLIKVVMTGESLLTTLEHSVPFNNNQSGWFYYFSGLKMEFAPAAQPGSRIKSVTDLNGNTIDPQKEYTVAVMDKCVPTNLLISSAPMGITIGDLLEQKIATAKTISPSKDGRFVIANP